MVLHFLKLAVWTYYYICYVFNNIENITIYITDEEKKKVIKWLLDIDGQSYWRKLKLTNKGQCKNENTKFKKKHHFIGHMNLNMSSL